VRRCDAIAVGWSASAFDPCYETLGGCAPILLDAACVSAIEFLLLACEGLPLCAHTSPTSALALVDKQCLLELEVMPW
jgi:hypothetical protein